MIGADLREWRKANGFTQDKLSLALGVTRQTVIQWESAGEPLARLVVLALAGLEAAAKVAPEVAGERLSVHDYRRIRGRVNGINAEE